MDSSSFFGHLLGDFIISDSPIFVSNQLFYFAVSSINALIYVYRRKMTWCCTQLCVPASWLHLSARSSKHPTAKSSEAADYQHQASSEANLRSSTSSPSALYIHNFFVSLEQDWRILEEIGGDPSWSQLGASGHIWMCKGPEQDWSELELLWQIHKVMG